MSVVPTRPTRLLATLHHSARRAVVASASGAGSAICSRVSGISSEERGGRRADFCGAAHAERTGGAAGRDQRAGRAGRRPVDELAVPELEHHAATRCRLSSASAPARVTVEQALERVGPEVAARQRAGVEQDVARPRRAGRRAATTTAARRSPASGGRGCRRAASRACASRRIHFFSEPRDLQPGRDARGELHQLVVEERRARLERVGHGGDVDLRQQVAGQVGRDVDVEHLVDDVRRPTSPPRRRRSRRGAARLGVRREVGLVERVAQRQVEQLLVARRSAPAASSASVAASRRARLRGLAMWPPLGQPRGPARRRRGARARQPVQPAGQRVGDVARVAAERLVAAVAVERDGDVAPGRARRGRSSGSPVASANGSP